MLARHEFYHDMNQQIDSRLVALGPKHVATVLFAAICALFAAIYLHMPCRTLYSPDEGVKYLQMMGLESNPLRPCHLVYTGLSKDPSMFYYPGRAEAAVYHTRIYPFADATGRVQTKWLPWFPFVTKLAHRVIGMRGLYLIPLLAGLVALWLTGAVAATLEPGARWMAVLAFALSSPLLFYSITFWEHTLSLVFLLLAMLCVLPIISPDEVKEPTRALRLTAAAVLLLCSIAIRRETMFFAAAVGLALAMQAGSTRLRSLSRWQLWVPATAMAAAAIALVALSPWILPSSTAADLHATLHRLTAAETWLFLDTHFFNVFLLLKEEGPLPAILRWSGQAGLLTCIASCFWPRARRLSAFLAGAVLLLVPALFLAVVPVRYRALHSLFLCAPLVTLALLPVPDAVQRSAAERFIRSAALLSAVLYFVGTWPTQRTDAGLEWGSRYAFVLFSLLLAIGSANWLRWRQSAAARGWRKVGMHGMALLMLLTGSISAVRGVRELNTTRRDLGLIQDALSAKSGPIVTDCWWMGAGLVELFTRHEIYTIITPEELHDWLNTAGKNEPSFVYASYEPIPQRILLREKGRIEPVESEAVCGMTISTYSVTPTSFSAASQTSTNLR